MDAKQAKAVFDAVLGMMGPTQALYEAQAADAMGDLSEDDLIAVMTDYVENKARLDAALVDLPEYSRIMMARSL